MARRPLKAPPFGAGRSLFVFEEEAVRILGHAGSEAVVPFEDLKALLDYLDESEEPLPAHPAHPPERDG